MGLLFWIQVFKEQAQLDAGAYYLESAGGNPQLFLAGSESGTSPPSRVIVHERLQALRNDGFRLQTDKAVDELTAVEQ